jgi:hypothetical protein
MPTVNSRFGAAFGQFVEHRLHHARRELLARQAIAPADDARHRAHAVRRRLRQRGHHVLVERLAVGARFLAAVEHGNGLHVAGSAASSAVGENGRYSRTFSTPTFSPRATR